MDVSEPANIVPVCDVDVDSSEDDQCSNVLVDCISSTDGETECDNFDVSQPIVHDNLGQMSDIVSYKSIFNCRNVLEFKLLEDKYASVLLATKRIDFNDDPFLEEKVLNWSFDDEDMEVMLDGVPVDSQCKVSSPMFVLDRNVLDITDRFSSIGVCESRQTNSSLTSDSSFFLWLEQSLSVQEELVDRISTVSQILNDACVKDVSDVLTSEDASEGDTRSNILSEISSHVKSIRENVTNFRLKKDTWQRRCPLESRVNDLVIDEASDVLLELPTDASVYRRTTRSHGPVTEYPRVQQRTLEYKTYTRL